MRFLGRRILGICRGWTCWEQCHSLLAAAVLGWNERVDTDDRWCRLRCLGRWPGREGSGGELMQMMCSSTVNGLKRDKKMSERDGTHVMSGMSSRVVSHWRRRDLGNREKVCGVC